MASLSFMQPARSGCVIVKHDATALGIRPVALVGVGVKRLPTDAIGTFTLAIKNAVRGSRYVIERPSDDSLATPTGNAEGVVPAGAGTVTDVNVTLDYYAAGNTNNDLRITLRNASGSPAYREFVTQITAQAGTVIAYCLQQTDE